MTTSGSTSSSSGDSRRQTAGITAEAYNTRRTVKDGEAGTSVLIQRRLCWGNAKSVSRYVQLCINLHARTPRTNRTNSMRGDAHNTRATSRRHVRGCYVDAGAAFEGSASPVPDSPSTMSIEVVPSESCESTGM
jgi:hypothetical protein